MHQQGAGDAEPRQPDANRGGDAGVDQGEPDPAGMTGGGEAILGRRIGRDGDRPDRLIVGQQRPATQQQELHLDAMPAAELAGKMQQKLLGAGRKRVMADQQQPAEPNR